MTKPYADTTEDAQATQQPDRDDLLEVPVRPPREPAAYRPTDHFIQRLRERVPEYDSDLPRRLIEDGTATCVRGDSVEDGLQYGTPVGFTDTVEGKPWTVVVALRPAAFVDGDDVKHRALTVFQGTPTPPGQDADAGGERA
jgi:hypothetical protein